MNYNWMQMHVGTELLLGCGLFMDIFQMLSTHLQYCTVLASKARCVLRISSIVGRVKFIGSICRGL